jgi:signal transduction histidine kinase/ActR/RegA family two-component response regulator
MSEPATSSFELEGISPVQDVSPAAAPPAEPEDSPELRRLYAADAWPKDARYNRLLGASGVAADSLGWFTSAAGLGASRLAYVLLAVHLLGASCAVPLFASGFARTPPRWVNGARLLAAVGTCGMMIATFALRPTEISTQGFIMVVVWAMNAIILNAPLWPKLGVHAASFALFFVHVRAMIAARGDAYATPREVFAVAISGALAAFLVPWVPHRMEERRFREFVIRRRLEREIRTREQREREVLEEKRRADRAAEEARRAAALAAEEARRRTELFANMSHDLRTPMAGILGLVELMRDTPLSAEQIGYIETIRASNQTLLSLLDDVIDFARLEEGRLPIVKIAAPVAETLRRPAELMRVVADRKQLALRVELAADLPAFARLDPARVQQILLNLLGNAVKFTLQGGVTLRARALATPGGPRLRVEIEDTGIGFTAEQRERLFQRFSQAEEGIIHKFGGSGLGLSICKGLVDLMGGSIGAEGEPGRGARFWFELPLEAAAAPVESVSEAAPPMRVLLAEDNAVNQLVLSIMLKKLGQDVSVASDGEQALKLLLSERFDLAILDMQMPLLDGAEVTRRLRLSGSGASRTRVVALTASATAEQQAAFLAAGVDAVYSKPIDIDRLRRLLARERPAA